MLEILITNDDGYDAKGINTLIDIMATIGNVTVIAPDGPRSGQSNAITVTQPLRLQLYREYKNVRIFTSNGTPTDCVKLAINELYKEKRPDLLVSGINHGSNAAINVIYSGTMGAVLEGCENGIASIGFSICDHSAEADFSYFAAYIPEICKLILSKQIPYGTGFNVNAPKGEIKGVRWCRQCRGYWTEEFAKCIDPMGRNYYWLTGYFKNLEPEATDTDEWALANGYISIVPTKIDLTDYQTLQQLKE